MLDRGLEDDWFGSTFIVVNAAVTAIAFALMIPWEMTRSDPMIDVRMVGSRQFGACFLVMGATGAILYATTQFLPLLLQTDFGYTADLGRARAVAGRARHDGDDVRDRRHLEQGSAQIPDHGRRR